MLTRRRAARLIAAAAVSPLGTAIAGSSGTRAPDVVVIGAGAFGAWTAHALHAAGARVVLLDAYGPGNDRSSSGGESRITRSAYGDAEIYARWAMESLPAWQTLQQAGRTTLFENTGVLTIVPPATHFVADTSAVLTKLAIPFEVLSADETMRRFPQFHLDPGESAIFEPRSGALYARHAIQTLVSGLAAAGVDYRLGAVRPPAGEGTLAAVTTMVGEVIPAGKFVFACGTWLPRLFPTLLGGRIHAQRGEVFFLGVPPGDARFLPPAMPTWIDTGGVGGAYGMPSLEGRGCKVAVDSIDNEIDPDTGDRAVSPPYAAEMRAFVRRRFPALADAPVVETRVCQYEMTAGENYILDRHPAFDNVWIAGGGSGHGFKTSPAVGRYVARLVLGGGVTDERFRLPRPG